MWITAAWQLITLVLNCETWVRTTIGEDLAATMEGVFNRQDLKGRVVSCTTDCEPLMVKAGRLLMERNVCTHVGCCNRRLESTGGVVFNGPGLKKTMPLARGLVTRYTKSS